MSGSLSPAVLVACDDLILLDEVIRHLEEVPQWRLVAPAQSVDELLAGAEAHLPDVIVMSEGIALDLAYDARGGKVEAGTVIFSREESTEVLRAGLRLGAHGFVLWPQEKGQLKSLVEKGLVVAAPAPAGAGLVHAVWSPKGGAGASVLAAHLAAGISEAGRRCTLVDLDIDHADQRSILRAESEPKSILDLLRVGDELSAQMIQSICWAHPGGFRALLSPGRPGEAALVKPAEIARLVRVVGESSDHLVLDVPSTLSELSMAALQEASTIVLVLTPDLLGLRRAQAAVAVLRSSGVDGGRFHPVLNQAGGPDITAKEVSQVLNLGGRVTRVPADYRVYRSTNRGELSASCSRMIGGLAKRLAAMAPPSARPVPPPYAPVPLDESISSSGRVRRLVHAGRKG
ncbi:MAG: AAA family ATPase [Actinomycetota bacterium]